MADKDVRRLKSIVGKVEEQSKIRLDQMIMGFIQHPELKDVTFPNELSNMERAYVHFQATRNGFESFSSGTGGARRITLRRVQENTALQAKPVVLTPESISFVYNLIHAYPNPRAFFRIPDRAGNNVYRGGSAAIIKKGSASRLSFGPSPKVPRPKKSDSYLEYRRRLPIWGHQNEIIELLKEHRVVFIKGSTGCGKTTQVGQFILDHAYETSQNVRIICTVPRRIAAISVSDRVAAERGEKLGQVVGYQIRLESCSSPTETLLTFCTSGILLRSLSAPDYRVLTNTTHIIIDEIHERDRQTDFLLTCLRDIIALFPDLRLIIMGADLNDDLFSSYFRGAHKYPIVQVEGRLHPVQVHYLEDVLEMLKYENHDMEKKKLYNGLLEKLSGEKVETSSASAEASGTFQFQYLSPLPEVDAIIERVWTTGDELVLNEFLEMVRDQGVPVDYQHSEVNVTMLMAAAVHGMLGHVSWLLNLGADLCIKSKVDDYEFSAIDWAQDHRQHEVSKFLLEHHYKTKLMPSALSAQTMDPQKAQRLAKYLRSIDEERVDLSLIFHLLHEIHMSADPSYGILVFLPGYDEIVTLKHLILSDTRYGFPQGSFLIFMLHSNIQSGDQRAAFQKPPNGVRKIVLSTNIAESSLTFEDIVVVIDSGKVKEKSFDSLTNVTQLKSVWVSKASINQRRGRAGRCRPGICYHLFSSARYEAMPEYPVPEIVRTSLQELCLQARSFMRPDVKIERFFTRIPEPPAPIAVKKAVERLKIMGALDEDEQLTKLGSHLLDFPLEPFLGKALIYAVVFRCLDPILTLVSVISYRDPFQLPSDPQEKQRAQERKMYFAHGSFSDHMAYLKAFQDWEKSKLFSDNTEHIFCHDNYLSSNTFEMVYAIRSQLLGQLRASGFVKNKGKSDLKELNKNSSNWALVKGVLVTTLYPNICGIDRGKTVLYNSFNNKVSFHPSTTFAKQRNDFREIPTDWIIFDEMTQQGSMNLVKGCTCVSTAAIALFAGSFSAPKQNDENLPLANRFGMHLQNPNLLSSININQWITLEGQKCSINVLLFLREKIKDVVLRVLVNPSAFLTYEEESTIQVVAALLAREDNALGFKNVDGIDQWPKLVSGNLMSAPKKGWQ